jgi:Tol biopolymer transport system component
MIVGNTTTSVRQKRGARQLFMFRPAVGAPSSCGNQRLALCVAATLAAVCGSLPPAHASCNAIPGTVNSFRASLGVVDRPFAGPGDFVAIRLLPGCDDASAGFAGAEADHVVSVMFTPPAGPRTMVVLAADCAALAPELAACAGGLGAPPRCLPAAARLDASDMQLFERDGAPQLRFRFPDTDALLDAPDDDRTLAGPAALAVTRAAAPLPCDLGIVPCGPGAGMVACIDTLFELDGTCGTTPNAVFPHFTALPPPNNYQALCVDRAPPCNGTMDELHVTTDTAGNLLIPMDWQGILPRLDSSDANPQHTFSIPRLLRLTMTSAGLPSPSGVRPDIPGPDFVHSYSPDGGLLPPVFEPQVDPSSPEHVILFGSADAPASVLRIARRSPVFKQCRGGRRDRQPCAQDTDCPDASCGPAACAGGERSATPCASDADCPGGECGASLFDFRRAFAAGIGPVILPRGGAGFCQDGGASCAADAECAHGACVRYRFEAKEPVPLDGLVETPSVFVAVVPEAIEGRDLNGDGDRLDDVLLLSDRRTGLRQPIGVAPAEGLAATRLSQPPFSYAAVAVEDGVTAFLEAEPRQNDSDLNGDGDRFDTILRVFDSSTAMARDLTADLNLAVDAEPAIDGKSLAISDGLVFFRIVEAANARRRIVRASVSAAGEPANGHSQRPALSRNGRQVAFESAATNLSAQGDVADVTAYVHDLAGGGTVPVQVTSEYALPNAPTHQPALSEDGRFVVVSAPDTSGTDQIFVVDRDADGNGVFDEAHGRVSRLLSVTSDGAVSALGAFAPAVTPDGRYVAFVASGLGQDPRFPSVWAYVRDTALPDSARPLSVASINDDGVTTGGVVTQIPAISDDGRFVAYASFERDQVHTDHNEYCQIIGSSATSCADIILRDRIAQTTALVSLSSSGEQGNNQSLTPALSADGRYVAFESAASNLVGGDTNGAVDVFVRDLRTGTTTRASVSSDGIQGNGSSFDRSIGLSATGRYVAFSSRAGNLVPDDSNDICDDGLGGPADRNCGDVFVHDLLTGFTERVSVGPNGLQGDGNAAYPSISGDGQTVAFESAAQNLVPGAADRTCAPLPGDTSTRCRDIFVAGPDPSDLRYDLNGDGDLDDTVLATIDARDAAASGAPAAMQTLGPATAVSVAAGRAAFLLPETAVRTPPTDGTDLNGDGDTADTVVHLFDGRGGGVRNLGLAAVDLSLSDRCLAVLVSEAGQGATDLNGDGDAGDRVVHVYDLDTREWTNLGLAADAIEARGTTVAFLTAEIDQGVDLNNDGDREDRVLQIYDVGARELINVGVAVDDFVVDDPGAFVAFRVSEAADGGEDLNGDGDANDAVMHVYDVAARRVYNTGQAAVPCRLEACDPRLPYRMAQGIVKFLELEDDQHEDLNQDGDETDVVLQTFNVNQARREPGAGARRGARSAYSRTRAAALGVRPGALTTVGAVTAGICTNSGRACASAADCSGGRCYLPPGGCILNTKKACDPNLSNQPCAADEFCASAGSRSLCYKRTGGCVTDADCPAPARCFDEGRAAERLLSPLFAAAAGEVVFVGAGQCAEDLGVRCDPAASGSCPAGAVCSVSPGGASCRRLHGTCATEGDCPRGTQCQQMPIVLTASDSDGDGVPDPFDNCPLAANPAQEDLAGCVAVAQPTAPAPTQTPTTTAARVPSTPVTAHDVGGCHVAPVTPGSSRWHLLLLIGAGVLLCARTWSRRRACRLLASILGFVIVADSGANAIQNPLPAADGAACTGDCDGSGTVTVDEIVTLVDALLSGSVPAGCAAADRNGDLRVTVDEVVAAIGHAAVACPPPAPAVARAALSVSRALANVASLPLLLVAAVGALGESGACTLGGAYSNTCVETSGEFIRIPVVVRECREPTLEGPIRFNGQLLFTGVGLCPNILLPGSTTIETDVSATREAPDGAALLVTDSQLTVVPDSFSFSVGRQGCAVRGTQVQLGGAIRYALPDGLELTLRFDAARAAFEFLEFSIEPLCDIVRIVLTLDGPARVEEMAGGSTRSRVDVGFDALAVTLHRPDGMVEIAGAVTLPALTTTLELSTPEPLVLPTGASCFTAGVLAAAAGETRVRLRFDAGDVQLDADGDGVADAHFASCDDLPGSAFSASAAADPGFPATWRRAAPPHG